MFSSLILRQDLLGASYSNEKGDDSGLAYIFCRMNQMWEEESNIIPTDGAINCYLGYDVALSEDTPNIGSHRDCDMGLLSGSINVFFMQEGGALEEAPILTPAVEDAGYEVVISVDIYYDTDVIGEFADNDMGIDSGSGFF